MRRVQQLVKEGRLPVQVFGGSLVIGGKDLALVAERNPGRGHDYAIEQQALKGVQVYRKAGRPKKQHDQKN